LEKALAFCESNHAANGRAAALGGFVYLDPASVANDLRIPQSTGVPQHSGPSNLEGQDQIPSSAKLSAIVFSDRGLFNLGFRFNPQVNKLRPP
jgi:hypothetical protein